VRTTTRDRLVAYSRRSRASTLHEHCWVAATLYHLTAGEASTAAELPDFLADIGEKAPRETVGPFCLECGRAFEDV
jgi:hypothetical protein